MISHKRLANWYLQLAQHLEAGIALPEVLLISQGVPTKGRSEMANQLISGVPLTTVLESAPNWFPQADRVFLSASEQTGRLPQTFSRLSERHAEIGANQAKAILGLAYPLLVFHVAVLILPLVRMIDYDQGFNWSASEHFAMSALILVPAWICIAAVVILAKTENPLLPTLLRCLPFLRRYSKRQALADFSYGLGTFIETGIKIDLAWKHATRLSGDSRIHAAYKKIQVLIDSGADPSQSLHLHSVFPADFTAFYQSGVNTGQLDVNLIKIAQSYQKDANQAMSFAAIIYPSIFFAVIAGFIVYSVFTVYGGYVNLIIDMAQ